MEKLRYRFKILRKIYPYFHGSKLWFVGDVISEIIIRIVIILVPVLYGIFIEKVILGHNTHYMVWVIAGYILLQMVKSGATLLQKHCQNKVNNTAYRKLRVSSLNRYFQMRFDAYECITTGDINMTLEEGINKLTSFQIQLYQYCINALTIVVMAIILISIDWRLAVVALLATPVTFVLDHIVSKREKDVNKIINENDSSWTTWLDETMKGWKEIRVSKYEEKRKKEFEEFLAVDETYFRKWLRFWVTRVMAIPKIKDDFIMQFLLYFIGGILIYYKYTTIGMLLIFVQYYSMLSDSVKAVSTSDANLQSEMPHYERIVNHLSDDERIEIEGTAIAKKYDIVFDNVTFAYEGMEENVLNNISFHIKEGDRVGFFGESGAGKSTLLKLMLGQLRPSSGNIKYGEIALSDICKKKLYKKIAYISQESKLFNESILENLRMGNENATMKEIEEACKQACIYDFIKTLPEGFETEVGENGSKLSGGQRQRVLLAKAFLKNADIYILDEATSALDNQVEESIIDTLKNIPKVKTVIVVAHNEYFLEMCDYTVKI